MCEKMTKNAPFLSPPFKNFQVCLTAVTATSIFCYFFGRCYNISHPSKAKRLTEKRTLRIFSAKMLSFIPVTTCVQIVTCCCTNYFAGKAVYTII